MGLPDSQKIAVAFCSPHRKIRLPNGQEIVDTITTEWHRRRCGLSMGTNISHIEFFVDGLEIGEAREAIVHRCLAHDPVPKYLFWLDDDVLPDWDAFIKLFFRAQTNPDYDVFAGVYACKQIGEPLIYAGNGEGPFWDWAVGDLLTTEGHGITGCHSGLTLIRTSLFLRMREKGVVSEAVPFYKTVKETWRDPNGSMKTRAGTEDLYFCQLARNVGAKFMVDTSVLAGHIDKSTGITWGMPRESPPAQRAHWLNGKDKEIAKAEDLKLALDIGAGVERRQWAGHKTYTLDLRPETKCDYTQDLRYLNLPDNHFDLVASSHTFEHVPRWDQQKIWAEAFRVCKPGGQVEIVVPSAEWAAAKIADGQCDEHVMNVLYGAQEAHGYARDLNLHYFCYTKAIAQALAEEAGFTEVKVKDWREEETLVYNMVLTGTKPCLETTSPESNGSTAASSLPLPGPLMPAP